MKRLVIILLIVVFSILGCEKPTEIRDWFAIDGQVLDEQTGAPIAGAHVIALYDGVAAWTTSVCFHVENATTDDDGRFRIPAWTNTGMYRTVENQSFSIYAYKPGYRESDRTYKEQSYKKGIYYVRADSTTGAERLDYLLSSMRRCSQADRSEENLLPFYNAVHEEAKNLPTTKKERQTASTILQQVEKISMGYEVSWNRWRERKGNIK